MKKSVAALGLLATTVAMPTLAAEGPAPRGIVPLTHVWVIMMENHSFSQIMNNPNAPFINSYAQSANLATNFFAVGHPSLTNYLETVGGSNFGVRDDNAPDWHNASCQPNIVSGSTNYEATSTPICPIAGTGTDAATPAIDTTNEDPGNSVIDIDGYKSYAAASGTVGKTIADQFFAAGMTWKTYQQALPAAGADKVTYSDGLYTDTTNYAAIPGNTYTPPGGTPVTQLSSAGFVKAYAAKHNPFVYFKSVQEGPTGNNLSNVVGFEQLYADLASGGGLAVPNFSFIAPDQCHDQHGRGNGGQLCNFDANDNGTQNGLNPGLIALGDDTVKKIVTAIHKSTAWTRGHNAIVVLWDENDYSIAPVTNQIAVIVDTNYGVKGTTSPNYYTHFSLLKSLEAGFGLPCLNHACDSSTAVMKDLFAP